MGPPLLIGAGIGAATSLAMGKSPFMGALLGGATGGAFGGAGGFGSGFTEGSLLSGLTGTAPEAVSLGTGGYAALGQSAFAPAIAPIASTASTASTLPFGSTEFIGMGNPEGILPYTLNATETAPVIAATDPNYLSSGVNYGANSPNFKPMLGKSTDYTGGGAGSGGLFGSVKDMFGGLSTSDKLGLGMKTVDIAMRPEEKMPPPPAPPITRGNYDPSAVLTNVSPNANPSPSKGGLLDMMARIPFTDEERMRLQQLGYRG